MFICLNYLHYPVSIAQYFKRAFKRLPDHEIISSGPAFHDFIPWKGGIKMPNSDEPDIALPHANDLPVHYLEQQILAKYRRKPDLIITFNAAFHMSGRPSNGKYFVVGTDPHCVELDADRQQSDVLFNMQKFYSKAKDVYLPYAYDPEFHRVVDVPKEYDCCMIGMEYEHRVVWVNNLRQAGLNVCFVNGPAFDDALALYSKAKIGLNWSSLADLNARSFEIKAMGLLTVENVVPDLTQFFSVEPDKAATIAFPDNPNNHMQYMPVATQAVIDAVRDYDKLQDVRLRGLSAVQGNTYDARVAEIMKYI